MLKNALFLLKNRKNRRALGAPPQTSLLPAAGGFAPRPPASGSWELHFQSPALAPSHDEFLVTRLIVSFVFAFKVMLCPSFLCNF